METTDNFMPTRMASWLSLLTSSGTLVRCALPALLVTLGAGAALPTLVATVPQLVGFSEHKAGVFGAAAVMLMISGVLQWRSRRLPCPTDPVLARTCAHLRKRSLRIYGVFFGLFAIGGLFAFIAPTLG